MKKTPFDHKNQLRSTIKHQRKNWSATYVANIENKITSLFINFSKDLAKNQVIALYYAMKNEISVHKLLEILAENHRVCLPCIEEDSEILLYREYQNSEQLIEGKFSFFQPQNTAEILIPQIMLIPCLACDALGTRLGYGMGHHDRTLAKLRKKHQILSIGVCAEEHFFEELPREKHDQQLDYVITEQGMHKV